MTILDQFIIVEMMLHAEASWIDDEDETELANNEKHKRITEQ